MEKRVRNFFERANSTNMNLQLCKSMKFCFKNKIFSSPKQNFIPQKIIIRGGELSQRIYNAFNGTKCNKFDF